MSDIVKEVQDFYADAEAFDSEDRANRREDFAFTVLDDHWTQEEKDARTVDGKQRPMLCLPYQRTINRRIANELMRDTPSPKYRPVNSAASAEAAKVLNGLALNYLAQSSADIAFDTAGRWQVDVGLGYFELAMDYINGGSDLVPVVRPIYDPFQVYYDPESVAINGSDAMRCIVLTEMERARAEKLYGKDFSPFAAANSPFVNGEKVKIAKYYKIEEEETVRYELDNGWQVYEDDLTDLLDRGFGVVRAWETKRRMCEIYTVGGDDLLEDEIELDISWIPVIPVYGELSIYDGKRITRSMTRNGREVQRIINYAESSIVEYAGLAVKAKHIGPVKAFDGLEKFWEKIHTSALPFAPYNDWDDEAQRPINPPQLAHHPAIPQELMVLREGARKDLYSVCGMQGTPGMEGDERNTESGRAILAREKISSVGNFHYQDNRSKSIAQCGRIMLEMIRMVAKDSGSLRALDESGNATVVQHDPEMSESHAKGPDGAIYNLLVGEYECVADTGPSYATQRQEGQTQLMEMLKIAPAMLQMQPATVLRQFDSPALTDLADAFDPPDGQGDPKQQVSQLTQQVQQLQAQLQQVDAARVMIEQAKLQASTLIEQARLEIMQQESSHKMQLEEMRLQADIYGTPKDEFERRLKLIEAQRKQEEHEEDLLARQQEIELQKVTLLKDLNVQPQENQNA